MDVQSVHPDLRTLERLMPAENGLRVFDAETQETSYGIALLAGIPFIFDSHRKDRTYVATIELLTELEEPVRVSPATVERFARHARATGLLPIPYSGCFFKGNLHVYAFFGPVVGYDLASAGRSVAAAEHRLGRTVRALWPHIPEELLVAQRNLLRGRRRVRHSEDLAVLRAAAAKT